MTTTRLLPVVLAAAALVLSGCPTRPTVEPVKPDLVVAKSGKADYRTIQEALDAAGDGAVILVKPGTYVEEVKFPSGRKRITLAGSGPDKTVVDAGDAYAAVKLAGDGHRVTGLTLRGAKSHGVYVADGSHRIDRCLIAGNGDRGIYLSSMFGDGRARIDHCTIVANDVSGIYDANEKPGTKVTNSIVARNARGIAVDGDRDESIAVTYCCLRNESNTGDSFSGTGNITEDPQFVNPAKGNYRLKPGSPCKGTASDGSDMGCY